jgi:hypothetical protein
VKIVHELDSVLLISPVIGAGTGVVFLDELHGILLEE